MAHCDKCGKNLALVGRRHDCKPDRVFMGGVTSSPHTKAETLPDFDPGVCPTCGKRTRPLTGAERQRAYRQRQK